MKPAKRQQMSEKFDALGVTFDFAKTSIGEVVVSNKASRIEQLCEEVDTILRTGVLPSGKRQFASVCFLFLDFWGTRHGLTQCFHVEFACHFTVQLNQTKVCP